MSWLSKLLPPKIKREHGAQRRGALPEGLWSKCPSCEAVLYATCLLYTSDAADERSSVDLGGRRIIQKKKKQKMNKPHIEVKTLQRQ